MRDTLENQSLNREDQELRAGLKSGEILVLWGGGGCFPGSQAQSCVPALVVPPLLPWLLSTIGPPGEDGL